MAKGMAGKSTQSLVPKITSWRLIRNSLTLRNRTFDTNIGSDFLRINEADKLFAVRLIGILFSLLIISFKSPFSKFKLSNEPMLEIWNWKLLFASHNLIRSISSFFSLSSSTSTSTSTSMQTISVIVWLYIYI